MPKMKLAYTVQIIVFGTKTETETDFLSVFMIHTLHSVHTVQTVQLLRNKLIN